jgi:hypothetical protein
MIYNSWLFYRKSSKEFRYVKMPVRYEKILEVTHEGTKNINLRTQIFNY